MRDSRQSRRVPYDPEYATCERTDVVLLIYPEISTASNITKVLGIEPTRTCVPGRKTVNSHGYERTDTIHGWFFASEGEIDSKDLRDHLDWLLDRLLPQKEAILELQQEAGLEMSVNCVWWSAHGGGGPVLWPEQMAALVELNLECGFDIGFYGEIEFEEKPID